VELVDVTSEPTLAVQRDALDTLALMIGLVLSSLSSPSLLAGPSTLFHDLRCRRTAEEGKINIRQQDASGDDLSIEGTIDTAADEDAAIA
jgi:hypothetical protein